MAHGDPGDGSGVHGEFDPESGVEQRPDPSERNWQSELGGFDRVRSSNPGPGFCTSAGEHSRGQRRFSANPDDHYRSWRDRHMSELDRDYEDYCRERELQFRRDFETWRRQRHASIEPLRTGMTQSSLPADSTGLTQAGAETVPASPEEQDPTANATLRTSSRGRGRDQT